MTHETPILIYDGDCGVCTRAALWIADRADVDLYQFAELSADQIERLPADWRECAHFIRGDEVYSCGRAMEEAFLLTDHWGGNVITTGRHVPGYSSLREFGYRTFADNRSLVGRFLN